MSGWLVGVAGTTVLTQLIVATAKSCSQGSGDMRGANIVIVNEEFMFLPIYGMLWATGDSGRGALVAALIGADVVTFAWGWSRLSRRGFFRGVSRPSLPVGLAIATYGLRAQIGGRGERRQGCVEPLVHLAVEVVRSQRVEGRGEAHEDHGQRGQEERGES